MINTVNNLHLSKISIVTQRKRGEGIKTQQFFHVIISNQTISELYSDTFYVQCSDKLYMILHNLRA